MSVVTPRTVLRAALACGAVAAAGCGGSDSPKPAPPKGTPSPAAAQVAQAYLDAYTARDAGRVCRLLGSAQRAQLAEPKDCPTTVRKTLKQPYPKLTVQRAVVADGRAIATVAGSQRQIALVKEAGRWRVVDGGT